MRNACVRCTPVSSTATTVPVPSKPLAHARSPSIRGTLFASCGSRRWSSAMTSTTNDASSSASASGPTSSARSGTVSNSRRTACRLPRSRVFTWPWTVATSWRWRVTLAGGRWLSTVKPPPGKWSRTRTRAVPSVWSRCRTRGGTRSGAASLVGAGRPSRSRPSTSHARYLIRAPRPRRPGVAQGNAARYREFRSRATPATQAGAEPVREGEQAMCHTRPALRAGTGWRLLRGVLRCWEDVREARPPRAGRPARPVHRAPANIPLGAELLPGRVAKRYEQSPRVAVYVIFPLLVS